MELIDYLKAFIIVFIGLALSWVLIEIGIVVSGKIFGFFARKRVREYLSSGK